MKSAEHTLSEHDGAIKEALGEFFEDAIQRARIIHPRYELLWQELARVTQSGGKQLRPRATILAYQAFDGGNVNAVIPVAAAQEILHASLLVHDDIIDRELTRRGSPNVSGTYHHTHYHFVDEPRDRRHYSDSAALLGGDLLLAATSQLMDDCPLPRANVRAAQDVLHRIIFEVAGGQLLDTEAAFLGGVDVSAELIARYKTASYTFIGPLLIGASLAGADTVSLQLLEVFATHLGIAYQLNDDMLGTFGDESKTGKSTIGDLREGKKTFLIERFLAIAKPHNITHLQTLFGKPNLSDAEAQEIKVLIEEAGAVKETSREIDKQVHQARIALAQLNISDASRGKFESLVTISTGRHA